MKRNLSLLFLALAVLCVLTPTQSRAATVPDVVISEVAWAGSSLSTADEWLELTNMTDHVVDISGWLLDGAASSTLTLPAGSVIQPDSTYLIANYDKTATNSTLSTHAAYITTAVSLPNDKLKITLSRSDRTLEDSAGDGGTPLKGGSGGTGGTPLGRFRTMERLNASIDGSLATAWADATVSMGFKDGVLDLGTPGTVGTTLQTEISVLQTPVVVTPVVLDPVASTTVATEIPAVESPPTSVATTVVTEPVASESTVVDSTSAAASSSTDSSASGYLQEVPLQTITNATTDPTMIDSTLPADVDTATSGEDMCMDVSADDPSVDSSLTNLPAKSAATTDSSTSIVIDPVIANSTVDNASTEILPTDSTQSTSAIVDAIATTIPDQTVSATSSDSAGQVQDQPLQTIASDSTSQTSPTSPTSQTFSQNLSIASTNVGTLEVSELFPHPATGEAEWVELTNTSSSPVTTNGWTLTDASGAVTEFPNGTIPPGGFLVIENPKGKLNNDGDTVIVKDPNGMVIDSVMYNVDLGGIPAVDESLIRIGTHTIALTTTPTKGAGNIETVKATATASAASGDTTHSSSTASSSSSASSTSTTDVSQIPIVATNTETPAVTSSGQTQGQAPQPVATVETTNPSTSQTSPTSPTLPNLSLSEFYPNTGGKDATDEFIEIENDGDVATTLDGWSLIDAGGTRFAFAKTDSIAPHAFLAVMRPESKITLNNTGDTITLVKPDGSVAESQTYETAKSLFAFAKINGVWTWTGIPTPNEPNRLPINNEQAQTIDVGGTSTTSTTSSTTNTNGPISAHVLDIATAKLDADGTRVTVRGFVSVLPNVFNSQTIYLQDDTGGVQIYKSDCLFPSLKIGQVVTVTGILSHPNGEARIKVSNLKSLSVSSTIQTVTPTSVSGSENTATGSLITIAGTVISKTSTQALVDVDGERWTVDFPKGSTIDTSIFQKGSQVNVSGILTTAKGITHIKPRSASDVSTQQNSTSTLASTTNLVTPDANAMPKQVLAIVLALLAIIGLAALKLRPHLYALTHAYGRKQTLPSRS